MKEKRSMNKLKENSELDEIAKRNTPGEARKAYIEPQLMELGKMQRVTLGKLGGSQADIDYTQPDEYTQ